MLKKDKANDFMKEFKEKYGQTVWEVGEVVKGSKKAILRDDINIIHIKDSFIE